MPIDDLQLTALHEITDTLRRQSRAVKLLTFPRGDALYVQPAHVVQIGACLDEKGVHMIGYVGLVTLAGPCIVQGSVEGVAAALFGEKQLGAYTPAAPPANKPLKIGGGS